MCFRLVPKSSTLDDPEHFYDDMALAYLQGTHLRKS